MERSSKQRARAAYLPWLLGLSALGPAAAEGPQDWPVGVQSQVVLTEYSELSSNAEISRRLLSPLAHEALLRTLAQKGKDLAGQPLDLAGEKFTLYVPASRPTEGYALLVFVSPWPDANLPSGWTNVLDRHGVIYVSALRSGNDANVLTRRVPLAILAATNFIQRYAVSPQRVLVGGFSGGSRIALRLALGYPDLFRGALLDAGSDPIGGTGTPLPPTELFHQFQRTRIFYLTGSEDLLHLEQAAQSIRSLRTWCVGDIGSTTSQGLGHVIAEPAGLSIALESLLRQAAPEPQQTACEARTTKDIDDRMQKAASAVSRGDRSSAHRLLMQLDASAGGLAAPRIVELARGCECGIFNP